MTTPREIPRRARPPRREQPAAPSRSGRWWLVAAVLVALIGGGVWLMPRDDRIAETTKLQEDVLAAMLKGRERRQAIDQIIRNVDKMTREQATEVRDALGALWTRLERESVDAYAAAPAEQRDSLLDRDLVRYQVFRELRFAVAARAPRRDRGRPEADTDPARRDLNRLYQNALRERAKDKGVSL